MGVEDRRATIEAAWDDAEEELEQEESGTRSSENGNIKDKPIVDEPELVVDEPVVESPAGDKGRGKDGKFLPAGDKSLPDQKQQVLADKPTQGQVPKPEVPAQGVKAPVSWRPEVRGKFGKLEADVQEEINRREQHIEQTLRQTAQVRQFAEGFAKILTPYEAMIRAEGGNYHTAVDSLMKTAYHLRTAPPQQKALMVAQMIQQHGIDVNMLDTALSQLVQGKQAQVAQDPMAQYFQREIAPVRQFMTEIQQLRQQNEQRTQHELMTEMQTFANDPKNEFFEDVREVMADLIEAAANRGAKLSLQDAYTRATLAHPTISGIVSTRQMTASVAQRSAAARRARNASASLPSGGAPAGAAESSKPKDRRAQLEAAWDRTEEG